MTPRSHRAMIAPQPRAIVTLANGLPAYTRDRRIRQSDIDRYGSAALARKAKEMQL